MKKIIIRQLLMSMFYPLLREGPLLILNQGQSIVPIDEISTKTEVQEWKKEQEPLHPVHKPCYLRQM